MEKETLNSDFWLPHGNACVCAFKPHTHEYGAVVHIYNPNTWGAEAG